MMKSLIQASLNDLFVDKKIERIVKKIHNASKTKDPRKDITLNQQMLIFHHSGLLTLIKSLPLTKKEKVGLLSFLFNSDYDNTRKSYDAVANKNDDLVKTEKNYEFLIMHFERLEMSKLAKEFNDHLNKYLSTKKK